MAAKTMEFQTEQKQLMDIIIHSLYSHPEIFLRELISNSCDAIDKVRFEGLTDEKILEDNTDWKIKIAADKEKNTLTISDNGIGMSKKTIVENLGTIARSGTKAFLEQLKKDDGKSSPDLIGQFGVGFYSCFMVADKVTVISKMAGSRKKAVQWDSEGKGTYTLDEVDKKTRGTDIILHLKDDTKEFLEEWNIRNIIKKYSDYIEHPVVMDIEREEGEDDDKKKVVKEETLNSQKAIWLRSKDEVEKEQYSEFYKHISHDFGEPGEIIHYKAEGTLEFTALLFIPEKKPMDMFGGTPDPKSSLHLYVNRVQIMDDCDKLLPPYMRFVKGVVDSSDLPLNVSREMLQENAILNKIQSNLVKKILSTLTTMKEKENEKFLNFYTEFNHNLKEGLATDFGNREKVSELILFESTTTEPGKMTGLADYVERMKDDQEYIYFLVGESREMLDKSPYLEVFKEKDQEVLLMTDPIDEWALQSVPEYKEKRFKSIDKGEAPQTEEEKAKSEEQKGELKDMLSCIKEKLGDEVKEVRISTRLKESAAVLVSDDSDLSANMERIMKSVGKQGDAFNTKRILEINPDHESVKSIQNLFEKDKDSIADYAWLLYDQALVAEGSQIKDPSAFAKRINSLLTKACGKN
ncbi:MAG: molecular chaperone HtpG [Planctomycetota bacterium]|jgi:molecular chaperone HtpG